MIARNYKQIIKKLFEDWNEISLIVTCCLFSSQYYHILLDDDVTHHSPQLVILPSTRYPIFAVAFTDAIHSSSIPILKAVFVISIRRRNALLSKL